MIITKTLAKKLIKSGKAVEIGKTCTGTYFPDGEIYNIINRLDLQRTDHYLD